MKQFSEIATTASTGRQPSSKIVAHPASRMPAPALEDMPKAMRTLTRSLTSSEVVWTGRTATKMTKLLVPVAEAEAELSILSQLSSPGELEQIADIVKRVRNLWPNTSGGNISVAQDWIRVFMDVPLSSLFAAYEYFLRSDREFAPTPGQVLAKANEHTQFVERKRLEVEAGIANAKRGEV